MEIWSLGNKPPFARSEASWPGLKSWPRRPWVELISARWILPKRGRREDAETGINWDVVSTVADDLFPRSGE
jgi:hypothetical protein